jgi:transposase
MGRLTLEQKVAIRETFQQSGSIRETHRRTRISRKAIRRELDRLACPIPKAPVAIRRTSKLDPYKAKISYLVREKHLSAVRVMEEISVLGYDGGYSILKEYIRTVRPRHKKTPRPPIDHPPGQEAQMDWSPHKVIIGGREQVVHTGSIVLCYSRWLFMRHFSDETLESVIQLHEAAIRELGGITATITYDNMTTVGRHVGPGDIWINPNFKRVADAYGFEIVILRPGAKERHGMVERPFHYIENNFLAGREFDSLADLNAQADQWRWNRANVRLHGTLRQRPNDRLLRERPYLKPLPWTPATTPYKAVERKIHVDFCIAIDRTRYSANPNLIGETAQVRLYPEHLEIWVNDRLDCQHAYSDNDRQVLPEHEAIYKQLTGQRRLLEDAFMRLGEPAKAFYDGLRETRKAAAGYHLQRILQYADRHGNDVVAGALAYATRYGAFSADAVLRIVSGKSLNPKTHPGPLPENVRQWLRAYVVEKQNLEHYDHLLEGEDKTHDTNPD